MTFHHDDYNTGLFGCFDDCASCMDGFFCPYCQVSAQYNMQTNGKRGVEPCMCMGILCLDLWCTIGGALLAASIITRSNAKNMYGLTKEGGCASCCKAFWCAGCSRCQVYREMSIRNNWPGGICLEKPYHKKGLMMAPHVVSIHTVIVEDGQHHHQHHEPHGGQHSHKPQQYHQPQELNNGPVYPYGAPPPAAAPQQQQQPHYYQQQPQPVWGQPVPDNKPL